MGVMLDASVLIAAERERFDLEGMLRNLEPESPVGLSVITAAELLHGVERADTPERRQRRGQYVEGLLQRFALFELTLSDARVYSRIWSSLQSAGITVGAHDLLLAATCLRLGFRVATLNVSEFVRVPGLQLVDVGPYWL